MRLKPSAGTTRREPWDYEAHRKQQKLQADCSIRKVQVHQCCFSSVMFFSLLFTSLDCLLCCARVCVREWMWVCVAVWECVSVCARCRLLHTVGKIEGISSGSAVFLLLLSLVGGAKGWLHHSQPGECLKQPISGCPRGRADAYCTASLDAEGDDLLLLSHSGGGDWGQHSKEPGPPTGQLQTVPHLISYFSSFFFSFYPLSVFFLLHFLQ